MELPETQSPPLLGEGGSPIGETGEVHPQNKEYFMERGITVKRRMLLPLLAALALLILWAALRFGVGGKPLTANLPAIAQTGARDAPTQCFCSWRTFSSSSCASLASTSRTRVDGSFGSA